MRKYILILLLALLTSCKNKQKSELIEVVKSNPKIKKQKINCFQKKDSLQILKIVDKLKYRYEKEEDISSLTTKKYKEEFDVFPYKLFIEALKNDAKPDFKIESSSSECNILAVYYNYVIRIVDDGEEYSSESSLIFYFTKNNKEEILLDGFGAAG